MNRLTLKIDSVLIPPLVQHSASPIQESETVHELSLPCPSSALLDLALAFSCPASQTDRLHRVLRLTPPLLLFALNQYRHFVGTPADSPNQLVVWCEEHLLPVTLNSDLLPCSLISSKLAKENRQLLKQFLRSHDSLSCRKTLERWVKLHGQYSLLANSSDARKRWLKTILAKSFRVNEFRVRKIRRKSTLDTTCLQWTQPSRLSTRIKSILELATTASQTKFEYLHKLETEKLAAMKQLAYGASHEINNPLANIATRAQTMLGDETHPEKRNKLATIYQQAMRAHEMISDMMLFAHPPATNATFVSLRQVVRRFIGQQENNTLADELIKTNIFLGPHLDRVCLDQTQFLVVLQMLVRNAKEAIRATKNATGDIEIRLDWVDRQTPGLPQRLQLGQASHFLQVSVQDNGIGVDARVRRHLFDPFFSGREAGRGLGFGLSKTWRIVEQHGGEIVFDETLPQTQGARFVFWLPQPN